MALGGGGRCREVGREEGVLSGAGAAEITVTQAVLLAGCGALMSIISWNSGVLYVPVCQRAPHVADAYVEGQRLQSCPR